MDDSLFTISKKLFVVTLMLQRIILRVTTQMGNNLQLAVKSGYRQQQSLGRPYLSSDRRSGMAPCKEFDYKSYHLKHCRKEQAASVIDVDEDEEDVKKLILTVCASDCQSLTQEGPFQIEHPEVYPYSATGMVLSKVEGAPKFGTGCLIGPNLVLTCAHNCYDARTRTMHKEVQYLPAPLKLKSKVGFKVKKVYVPEKYMKADIHKESKYNDTFLYDYAVLVLDTEMDLESFFGSFGFDFDWQEPSDYSFLDKKDRIIDEVGMIGFKTSLNWGGISFCELKGNAVNDPNFLVYTMDTYYGLSGSPIFSYHNGSYIIRGIHQRDISDIIDNDSKSLTKKAGLKLRLKMFEDINIHFRSSTHRYNLEKKKMNVQTLKKATNEILARYKLASQDKESVLSLNFTDSGIQDKGCEVLSTIELPDLHQLDLCSNGITEKGCRMLAKAVWNSLHSISLKNNDIGPKGIEELALANWKQLQNVDLWRCQIGPQGCEALTQTNWSKLYYLNLRNNEIREKGCQLLSAASWRHLHELNLKGNHIKDKGCEWLSKSSWKNLAKLNVNTNEITERGCWWLAQGPWLNLEAIDIMINKIGKKGHEHFKDLKWKIHWDEEDVSN